MSARSAAGRRMRRGSERLRELGHSDEAMARIRGPVGLNIEAVSAPEIALSILAEFVAVRRNAAIGRKGAGEGRRVIFGAVPLAQAAGRGRRALAPAAATA